MAVPFADRGIIMVMENEEAMNSLCCLGLSQYSYKAEIRE